MNHCTGLFLLNVYAFLVFFNCLLSTISILMCTFHREGAKQTFRLTHLEISFSFCSCTCRENDFVDYASIFNVFLAIQSSCLQSDFNCLWNSCWTVNHVSSSVLIESIQILTEKIIDSIPIVLMIHIRLSWRNEIIDWVGVNKIIN